jgi:plasmid maintenance system antidote protein VapI
MKFYTESDVVAELKKRADSSSQLQVANEMEIHPSMLNDLIHGRRAISERMAKKLGFVKKVVFNKAPKG